MIDKRIRNIELIREFKKYVEQGIPYSKIEIILGKDKRQFSRWKKYIKNGVLETA